MISWFVVACWYQFSACLNRNEFSISAINELAVTGVSLICFCYCLYDFAWINVDVELKNNRHLWKMRWNVKNCAFFSNYESFPHWIFDHFKITIITYYIEDKTSIIKFYCQLFFIQILPIIFMSITRFLLVSSCLNIPDIFIEFNHMPILAFF